MLTASLARSLLFAMAASLSANAQCTTSWQAMPAGSNALAFATAVMPSGDLVIGGRFTNVGTVSANAIARWDGTSWLPLGSGMTGAILLGTTSIVYALLVLPDGDLIAAGTFTAAGGVSANSIARWDGATWSPLGGGIQGIVRSLAMLPNGDIIAAGLFPYAGSGLANHIARWDGSDWHPMGDGVNAYFVNALLTMPNGDLIAGGNFWIADGVTVNKIARWDGVSWSALGSGMSGGLFDTNVQALALLPNGDLVAGGNFSAAGGVVAHNIARWDGLNWSPLGSGVTIAIPSPPSVAALSVLPNGDLLAGGAFTTAGGVAANYVARWNGSTWSPVDAGMDRAVRGFLAMPNGDRVASGSFSLAGAASCDGLARLTTTCPATGEAYGTSCNGPSGPTAVVSNELPWIDSTFRATATGMPANGLAVGVFGFSPLSLPMPSVHALGVAGCELLVTDEILLQITVANGRARSSIAIPGAASLVGAQFYHQVVGVELDASSTIMALTSTNALRLTIGVF
jgi:trimeric autotransporter adhesin